MPFLMLPFAAAGVTVVASSIVAGAAIATTLHTAAVINHEVGKVLSK